MRTATATKSSLVRARRALAARPELAERLLLLADPAPVARVTGATDSDAACIVEPRQVYRWALTRRRMVAAVIVAHNHPSGDPEPSAEDLAVTRRLAEAGHVVGVRLLDHLVIADPAGRVSLAERGAMPDYPPIGGYTS